MISCILIDDEISALKGLAYELNNFEDEIEIKAQFSSAANAICFLKSNDIDLVFLDIEMPEMNGLTFLDYFPNRNFLVVFTTAYSKYAINAIKLDALDYLLKPVDIDDLSQTIKKVEKSLSKKKQEDFLEIAMDRLNKSESSPKRIKISFDGKIHFLNPEDILFCEGEGNYCTVHLDSGKKMLLSQKLKQLESILPKYVFYRIHNSYIVNLQKVTAYHKHEGYVELTNNKTIPVSRHKRGEILDKL
jgi:two-component system LytT family response regulator